MSEMQFPPQGTKCIDCGCCLATVYSGNTPVCWECDEGVPCKVNQPKPARVADIPVSRPALQTSATPKPPALPPVPAKPVKAPLPEAAPKLYPTQKRIPEEVKEKIRREPLSRTLKEIALQYGVSDYTVCILRQEAKRQIKAGERPAPTSAPIELQPVAPSAPDPVSPAPVLDGISPAAPSEQDRAPQAPTPAPTRITLTLELGEREIDDWWDELTLAEKGQLMQQRLNGIARVAP